MDLIDRKAAIEAHYEYCNKHPDAGFPVWSLKILEDLPSAQPEIVQCEDCQHWEQETINDGYCTEMDLRMCDADFYCGYAERKTDEDD